MVGVTANLFSVRLDATSESEETLLLKLRTMMSYRDIHPDECLGFYRFGDGYRSPESGTKWESNERLPVGMAVIWHPAAVIPPCLLLNPQGVAYGALCGSPSDATDESEPFTSGEWGKRQGGMSIRSLAFAISRALDHDLPDHEYKRRDGSVSQFRPYEDRVEVYHFPQTWSDTSIGFGGVAGQAFTRAYTTVVIDNETRYACVYFGGRLAYKVEKVNQAFGEDLRRFDMAEVAESWKYS